MFNQNCGFPVKEKREAVLLVSVAYLVCAFAMLTITGCTDPVGGIPKAYDMTVETPRGMPVSILLSAFDHEDDTLTFFIDSDPANGALDLSGLPSVEYIPDPGFHGVDSFQFYAKDKHSRSNVATVYIGVDNNAPIVSFGSVATLEETPVTIHLVAWDPDVDYMFWNITRPTHGSLEGAPPALTYVPDKDFNGTDQVCFTVTDGLKTSGEGVLDLQIIPVNDAPVADPQSLTTVMGKDIDIVLSGSDVEYDPLTFHIDNPPAHGTLDTGALPLLVYSPDSGYKGLDTLSFHVSDGSLESNSAEISIAVEERAWNLTHYPWIQSRYNVRSQLDNTGNLHVISDEQGMIPYRLMHVLISPEGVYTNPYEGVAWFESGNFVVDSNSGKVHYIFTTNYLHDTWYYSRHSFSSEMSESVSVRENVNGIGPGDHFGSCVRIAPDGMPYIMYIEPPDGIEHMGTELKFKRKTAGAWIDWKPFVPDGRITDYCLEIDQNGDPHYVYSLGMGLFYGKGFPEPLKGDLPIKVLASQLGMPDWSPTTEPPTIQISGPGFLRIDSAGNPHVLGTVTFFDKSTGETRYKWIYVADGPENWGVVHEFSMNRSDVLEIAFDISEKNGNVQAHVAYTPAILTNDRSLKYVTNSSGTWVERSLGPVTGLVNGYYSVSVSASDEGWVSIPATYFEHEKGYAHLVHATNREK